jgi:anti-sigma regulatory factor (Ser/Thr protein kinase)
MGTDGSTTVLEPLWKGHPSLNTTALSASASCALPAQYEAVSSARDFTRRTLWRWGMGGEFDGVALVVSELVTNALRHGLTARTGSADGESPVRLHLMHWSASLVCAVRDPSGRAPEAAPPCPEPACVDEVDVDVLLAGATESGRGLRLVDSFSDCWGWHPVTGGRPGKIVWAMFRVDCS